MRKWSKHVTDGKIDHTPTSSSQPIQFALDEVERPEADFGYGVLKTWVIRVTRDVELTQEQIERLLGVTRGITLYEQKASGGSGSLPAKWTVVQAGIVRLRADTPHRFSLVQRA